MISPGTTTVSSPRCSLIWPVMFGGLIGTGFSGEDLSDLLDRLASPIAPDEFPDADPDALHIDYRCPSCGYEWSGQPMPGAEGSPDDPGSPPADE